VKTNGTTVGVLAALCISVTAAIALPLVNVFKSIPPSELMVVRGMVTAILIALVLTRHVGMPSVRMMKFSILFSLATLALYAGIRAWGASPTLVVLTTTPVVNIAAKRLRGQSVDGRVYLCLGGLLLGVMIALNPWQANFDLRGFLLSVVATLLAGIGFEVLARQKGIDPYNKGFWLAVVTVVVGFLATLADGHLPFAHEAWNISHALALVSFGVTGGFLYYLANIVAFEKLKTEVASTLAMAETPAVIVGSWFMLGETLTLIQWIGVGIALGATAALSVTEAR
jgi:drug/metabolite transporter (DMT)-like permease